MSIYLLYRRLEQEVNLKHLLQGRGRFGELGDSPAERELNALTLLDAGLWHEAYKGKIGWAWI
jgi:hypothetical protein